MNGLIGVYVHISAVKGYAAGGIGDLFESAYPT